ncbi:uncharacterized protein LOC143254425 isoform X2 [Tachypleus tridentatus]|uniref:uncharacterized protein LOC143254425 isoform X2 n=1 Tax=Tachypleus tridentatus TaxID=6853 RepID=UPI003FD23A39
MVYCVAYRCHNRSKRGSGISFFNFPSDPVRRKIWTQNINRANFTPTKYSRLCSDHFERDCYEKHVDDMARIGYQGGYNKLKPDAIPTIFYSRDVSKYKFKRADGDNTKVSVRSTMRFRRQSNRPRRAYGKRQHNYGDIEKISAQEDGRLFDKHLQLKSSSESREQVDQEDIVRDYVSDRSKKTDRLNTFEENLVKVLKSSTTKSQKRALSPVHQKSKKLKLNEKNNKDLYKDDSQSEKSQKANIVDLKATEVRTEEETVLHPNSLKSKPPELSEKITASVESTEEFTSLIEKNDSSNPNQNSEVRTSTDFSEEPANETDLSFLSDEAERYSDRPNKDCIMKEANGRDMKVPKTNGIDNKSSASNVTVKHENILTKSMLEQLVSEKILECLSEGSKNEIASLKQKCLILEKSVERWKKKAHELQKHIAMVLSGKRNCAGCWKGKVATRSVGLYVRMPSDVGTRSSSIPPIPVHLIANAATSQAVTVGAHRPIETTSSHSIIKVIDLTREKKENSKLGSLVTSIPEVSTSASNTVVKLSPRGSSLLSNVQTGPSGGVISIPTVYSSVPSVVHVIPSGAQISSSFLSSTGTTLRLAKSSSSVLSQGIPQGAKVTYLVPASSTALLGKNGESSPVFTSAVTLSSSSRITNSARQPIQTFLVRMASQQSGSYYRLLQTVNSSTVNLQTPVLNSAGSVLTTASSNTTTTQKSTSDTVVTPGSMQNTINLTCTSGTVMISCVSQHPAPLPEATLPSDVKDLPPKPALKASRVVNGIVLSWNMMLNGSYPTVVTYQLYGYQESARPPSTSMWKKVGDIKALPLPMACTLTQFVEGHKYHFAVRAVDVQKRIGAFSNPAFIFLSKQASSTS